MTGTTLWRLFAAWVIVYAVFLIMANRSPKAWLPALIIFPVVGVLGELEDSAFFTAEEDMRLSWWRRCQDSFWRPALPVM